MKTLGASIALRNGEIFDFPWRECIKSVLPICQEVVVAESDSTDDTLAELQAMAAEEPKIKIVHYPFRDPKGDGMWVMDWTNFARERLSTDYNLQMDADELLGESAYDKILARIHDKPVTLCCRRWNFYRDARHVIPFGHCCGSEVLRVAPKIHWLPADVPLPQGQDAMNLHVDALDVEIFHYNWLRKREAFFLKERGIQTAFFAQNDPRLDRAEANTGNWMEETGYGEWDTNLMEFKGEHPAIIQNWLRQRGWL